MDDDRRAALRAEQVAARRSVAPVVAHRTALRLRDRLLVVAAVARARRVAAYLATDGEIDLGPTIAALWRRGAEVSVPMVDGAAMTMAVLADGAPTRPGTLGIQEPVGGTRRTGAELDVVLMPAVALDPAGNRLGRGGGHYDRWLAESEHGGPRALRVGVVHAFQVVERIPTRPWDVPVDLVVTDRGSLPSPMPGQD